MALLTPGAVVAGHRIESVVGRGGMGVVYRARELELDRVVALKVIAPELLEDPVVRERFLNEARTAASIEHPNVVPVYSAGERDGTAFLVMRLIDGDDLRTLVRRDGPPAPGRAVDLIARAAAGLDAIHRAGFVHRDVKPANVLVDRDGHVYVTDFGLAKQALSRGGATATDRWVGTLDYVAPEQIRGGQIDARADVYALGGVLCFALTGHVPFERERDEAKLWAQLSESAPVPSRLRPGLPRALDDVVARAMAKPPDERYPSAGDLGRAAQAAVSGEAPSQPERMVARGAAAPGGGANDPGLTVEASTISASRPAPPPRSRRRWRMLAVALVVPVATAVFAVTRGSNEKPAAGVRVTQTVSDVGHRPNGIAIAGGDLWVTSSDQENLERVDAATGHARGSGPRVGMGAASIASAGTNVWVAVKDARHVVQIDAATARIVRRLRPSGVPLRVAVGLGSVWVGTQSGAVVRYDDAGNQLDRWPVPHGVAALAVGTDAVWIAEREVPRVLRLDPRTGESEVWASLVGQASALYFGAGYVWASLTATDNVVRIDPRRRNRFVTTAAGHRPAQIVVAGGRVFVASTTDHTVVPINPRTALLDGDPLRVDHNPYAIAADGRAVWVTGLSEDTLTRIDYR